MTRAATARSNRPSSLASRRSSGLSGGAAVVASCANLAESTSIFVIFSLRSPLGVEKAISSPRLRPSRALPTGDSLDSRFGSADGSDSVEPTIMTREDLVPSL